MRRWLPARVKHPAIRENKAEPLMWALAVAVLILAVCVISGGLYLNARRVTADDRQQQTRQAICTVLNALPPGSAKTPPRERRAFVKAYQLERCKPIPPPHPSAMTSPHPHRTTAVTPPVVFLPAPQPTATRTVVRPTHRPSPRPTVTRTKTAKPTPTHKPSPSPEPKPSCLLGINTTLTCPSNLTGR